MGRPKKTLSDADAEQIETMAGYGLSEAQIAHCLGMSPMTFRRNKRVVEAVSGAIERGKAKAQRTIGKRLFEKAEAGDLGSIVWWEKTRADRRETVKQEITGADGAPFTFTLKLDSPLDADDGDGT